MTEMDQLVDVQPGRRAVAVRHVPHSLDVFATHFPRFPVLPGVLILDDLTVVARLALGPDSATWVLAATHRARFRRFVSPGDVVEFTAELLERTEAQAIFRGSVRVDGRVVTTVAQLVLDRITTPAGSSR